MSLRHETMILFVRLLHKRAIQSLVKVRASITISITYALIVLWPLSCCVHHVLSGFFDILKKDPKRKNWVRKVLSLNQTKNNDLKKNHRVWIPRNNTQSFTVLFQIILSIYKLGRTILIHIRFDFINFYRNWYSCNISNTRKSVSLGYPNTEKRV